MRRVKVSRNINSLEEVAASLAAHRGRIGGNLETRVPASPDLGFSYSMLFDHMDSELARVARQLTEADDRHVRKLVQIRQLRRQRDQEAAGVYGKQSAARGILAHLYGKERDFELTAVSGATPLVPRSLAEQVDQTVKLLRNPEGEAPSHRIAGVGIDLGVMADDLETGHRQLVRVRAELVQASKEADGTRQLTNEAIGELRLVFLWIAQSLEGLFRLAGENELADRIRTSLRRVTRRRPGETDDEEKAESEEPSSESETAEASESEPSEATEETPATAGS